MDAEQPLQKTAGVSERTGGVFVGCVRPMMLSIELDVVQ
jgi:hypothetical protein